MSCFACFNKNSDTNCDWMHAFSLGSGVIHQFGSEINYMIEKLMIIDPSGIRETLTW